MSKKLFLITIDTEGDNLWGKPQLPGVENAKHIPRFQTLCEKFGFKPTYLTNYEMACAPAFVSMARDALTRGTAEVGCHVHAWDSPPEYPLSDADHLHHPFLIEYPEEMIHKKLAVQTELLEQTFGTKMLSHRAGRWAFDERYAKALLAQGYRVDCSVTPGVSWRSIKGLPGGAGGTDYTSFPTEAYYLDPDDISLAGASTLLEVPMTTRRSWFARHLPFLYRVRGLRGVLSRHHPEVAWLRPGRGNLGQMRDLVRREAQRSGHLEFMIHSSEFMPGGSPYFTNAVEVDQMFADLNELFTLISDTHQGATLAEFAQDFAAARPVPAAVVVQ